MATTFLPTAGLNLGLCLPPPQATAKQRQWQDVTVGTSVPDPGNILASSGGSGLLKSKKKEMCDCEKIWDTFAGCSRAEEGKTEISVLRKPDTLLHGL